MGTMAAAGFIRDRRARRQVPARFAYRLPSGLAPEVEAGDQPFALPHLALVAVVSVLRDRDRGQIVIGLDPVAGRELAGAVEAIEAVLCHPVETQPPAGPGRALPPKQIF